MVLEISNHQDNFELWNFEYFFWNKKNCFFFYDFPNNYI